MQSTEEFEILCSQGEHKVKFLVDGQWRLAAEWPSQTTDAGDTNNILVVT